MTIKCSVCRRDISKDDKYCFYCGVKFREAPAPAAPEQEVCYRKGTEESVKKIKFISCKKCGHKVLKDEAFCSICGNRAVEYTRTHTVIFVGFIIIMVISGYSYYSKHIYKGADIKTNKPGEEYRKKKAAAVKRRKAKLKKKKTKPLPPVTSRQPTPPAKTTSQPAQKTAGHKEIIVTAANYMDQYLLTDDADRRRIIIEKMYRFRESLDIKDVAILLNGEKNTPCRIKLIRLIGEFGHSKQAINVLEPYRWKPEYRYEAREARRKIIERIGNK